MLKIFGKKKSGANDKSQSNSGTRPASSNRSMNSQSSARSANGPGATLVDGGNAVFRVTVPEGVEPGQEFQVYAGNRIVRVRCPPGSAPGQSLQITVPTEDPRASGNAGGRSSMSSKDMPPDSPNVSRIEDDGSGGPAAYMVTIPDGIRGGQQFPVTIQGQQLMVTCPQNARPGMQVRIVPPPPPRDVTERPEQASLSRNVSGDGSITSSSGQQKSSATKKDKEATQLFEVEVPVGVKPGQPFALLAGGVRVLVTCPHNAGPGQRIRFKLPLALTQKPKPQNEAAAIKLSYDKDGWTRTIRVSDMKFQWVRMDDKGDIDNSNVRFHAEKSAYVRKLEFRQGPDHRIREGILSLVPATEAFVDSRIRGANDEDLVTYADIANAQVKNYEGKTEWFYEKCSLLSVAWNEGHMRINVRREYLLEDSVDAVMSLSRKDLRKLWRFEFIGEAGIDAGGLAREWFQLVTQEIFDPDMGLWQSSEANQMCMQINPASSTYIDYRVFLSHLDGRVLCGFLSLPPFSHRPIPSTSSRFFLHLYRTHFRRLPGILPLPWPRHGEGFV